jgi:hypothetical protein
MSLSLKEPLLVAARAAGERYSKRDQAHHAIHGSSSPKHSADENENDRPQKSFHSNKNDVGCISCSNWRLSKFLFPLLIVTQHATTLVLLFPFLVAPFGFEDEAVATVHALPPWLVIASSLTVFTILIWLYIHEKTPRTQEFLLRILHAAILGEMNIALVLILDKKVEIAIATLLAGMVGAGTFVLFSVQDCSSRSSSNNDKTIEEETAYLLTV